MSARETSQLGNTMPDRHFKVLLSRSPILAMLCLLFVTGCGQNSPAAMLNPIENQSDEPVDVFGHKLNITPDIESLGPISNVRISGNFQGPDIAPEQFSTWIKNANALKPQDPLLQQWHFAPWAHITFTSAEQEWKAEIFLGGLGFLTNANNQTGAFRFTPSVPTPKQDHSTN